MSQKTHIRRRSDRPNLCGAGGERYITVRTAQGWLAPASRRREGRTGDLCPGCVAALAGLPDPPTLREIRDEVGQTADAPAGPVPERKGVEPD